MGMIHESYYKLTQVRKGVMKITGSPTLSFCILIVVSTLDVVSSSSFNLTKYRYSSEFDGFRCVPDETLFVADHVLDHYTCGKICHNTYQCLDFFFQPENHRCIGCSVYMRSAYSTKRIEPLLGSTHFSEHGSSLNKACYVTRFGVLYSGYQSKTQLNKTCQRWDSQTPHEVEAHIENHLPERKLSLAENYCRDPLYIGRPWCYTTDPNYFRDYCDIPACYDRDCYTKWVPKLYKGYKSETRGGIKCQRWDQQLPHTHQFSDMDMKYFAEFFPDLSMKEANNYCRTPLSRQTEPWCITTDEELEWDFCDVNQCDKRECFMLGSAELYEGKRNVTKGNLTCQRWDQQSPHKHGFTRLIDFPDASIKEANNYCRSPNGIAPWCFTTNENIMWDYCDVEPCVLDYCFYESASTYQGRVYYTERRLECQRWDSTKPHNHDFGNMPSKFPDATVADAANYCRDPSGRGIPWCFTTDPNTVWDWCKVKKCWDNNV